MKYVNHKVGPTFLMQQITCTLTKETAELHIFTNRDLLHKKSWSNFVIDIFHGQTLALVHETCWLTSENIFPPEIVKKLNLVHLPCARFFPPFPRAFPPPL